MGKGTVKNIGKIGIGNGGVTEVFNVFKTLVDIWIWRSGVLESDSRFQVAHLGPASHLGYLPKFYSGWITSMTGTISGFGRSLCTRYPAAEYWTALRRACKVLTLERYSSVT
jgi:hypothetical protein